MQALFPGRIGIWKRCFNGGRKTGESGEKPSEQGKNQQQQTQPTCDTWGPFLEGPEKFSHPKSRCKISNLMITELFYSHMSERSLHTRSFRLRIYLSVFSYRLNGFSGPKRLGLSRNKPLVRESNPGHIGRRQVLSPLRHPLPSPAPPTYLLYKILDFIILFVSELLLYFLIKYFLVQFSVL